MSRFLISHINRIINVSEKDSDKILSFFKPMKLKKNEIVLNEGQTSQGTYFVEKGCLRIFYITEEGQESTRYFAFENQFATALVSFITTSPSNEYLQAVETSEVYFITHKDFYHLLEVVPQWEKFYRIYLENAYVNNTQRLMSMLTQDALKKYKQLLNENPLMVKRLSNKMVASYLNISQETLSRLKSKI